MNRHRIPILCYHRVCPRSERGTDSPSLCVTPEQFQRQMALLKWLRYNPVSTQSLYAFLQGRKNIPNRSIVLTFDDGYEDNYRYAFPILRKYSFSATIFLVTGAMGRKNSWDSGTLSMLNESQIQEMHLEGIQFGSHTDTHIDMNQTPEEKIREELTVSRKKVESLTSRFDIPFCYPYSRLNERGKTLVKEAGYCCAVSGDNGAENQADDLFDLMRIQVFPSTSLFGFWKKIQPWYSEWMKLQTKFKSRLK